MDSEYAEPDNKADLRRLLIKRRRELQSSVRKSHDSAIGRNILQLCTQSRCQRIAGFVAHGGEPDLMPALAKLHETGHETCLPVVRGRRMHFCHWRPDNDMAPNRFGIPEPVDGDRLEPKALELVLMPLVGFAPDGARLGMGAGFYDRAFAFRRERIGQLPRLIGVAYAVQEVETLPTDEWDIPLDGVVTEQGLQWFK
ncbi:MULTISPECIES: 5-formyltetrahydrofolate cyclo-ligase [unclassified Wenzhouxiangella]|uniref:5-formyltetrahydrofolate cyclo-ligase n=1 Tax=unclassified Wenzhouxiangella TaxID=2613841 RepID=UPI000E329F47|nr:MULTISPECIES: 5-formyltetrahydrofolate cyclo-ligase [unclassified Wenzhouxiangella]RFF26620.1 5-formyltetrahydrofolate cyclo-ligase [Wenzhouxiangella sp. 15181]RFP67630.1 5-formyltetrahydrofolate cyclo-ligase [Wenzhouxiangella sp. 15190]